MCIVCGGTSLEAFPASVAPFLSQYVWDKPSIRCHLMECRSCGMWFYDVRPTSAEMSRLYSEYRGERYCLVRNELEPGYRDINALLGTSAMELSARQQHFTTALSKAGWKQPSTLRCLDFGGDRGQQFPPSFRGAELAVYDISGTTPEPGVEGVSQAELVGRRFDLVMCNHVLEHVAAPRDTVDEIARLLDAGGYAYFEVPAEAPHGVIPRLSRLVRGVVGDHVADRLATVRGGFAVRLPQMHEHINLFSEQTLTTLAGRAGLAVVHSDTTTLDFGWTRSRIASCIARRRE